MNSREKEALTDDIAYLLEELAALKNMLKDIPVAERPVEQESILDMLHAIGYVQNQILEAVYPQKRRAASDAPAANDNNPTGKKKSADTGKYSPADIQTARDVNNAATSDDQGRSSSMDLFEKALSLQAPEDIRNADAIIATILAKRIELVRLVNRLDKDELYSSSSIMMKKTPIVHLLDEMVRFERNQLKKMAERIQTLERISFNRT